MIKTIENLEGQEKAFAIQIKQIIESNFEAVDGKIDIQDSLSLASVTMSIQDLFNDLANTDVDDIEESLKKKIQDNTENKESHTVEAMSVLIAETLAKKPYFKNLQSKQNTENISQKV